MLLNFYMLVLSVKCDSCNINSEILKEVFINFFMMFVIIIGILLNKEIWLYRLYLCGYRLIYLVKYFLLIF